MDFQQAVRTVLQQKYATFSGRARRSEFWWYALFQFIVQLVLTAIDGAILGGHPILTGIASLALLIPNIAVGVRRLHDTGRSGWWLLIAFVPLIGALVLLYFYIQDSTAGPNAYGPNPKTGETAAVTF